MIMSGKLKERVWRFVTLVIVYLLFRYFNHKGSEPTSFTPLGADNKIAEDKLSNAREIEPNSSQLEIQQNKGLVVDHKTKLKKDYTGGSKENATFVMLARNADLWSIVDSMREIEDRFNRRFNYDWVFLNDVEFTDEFKEVTSLVASGSIKFGVIPKEHWSFPEWIDLEKAAQVRKEMKEKKVIYGDSISYRHMCRYESGFFWRHPLLDDYEYYWRVEPGIKFFCNMDYDLFKFMKDNNKIYSFTVAFPEYAETIPTLWNTTKAFIKENPQFVAKNNSMDLISNDGGATYNGCHFWSNFEIASLDFWRSEPYQKYFEFLDKAGGFFYERWGDAPIHSIAVALFLPRDKIHFFEDIGYFHRPFFNCPKDDEVRLRNRCLCPKEHDFTWKRGSCVPKFFDLNNLERPSNWDNYYT